MLEMNPPSEVGKLKVETNRAMEWRNLWETLYIDKQPSHKENILESMDFELSTSKTKWG